MISSLRQRAPWHLWAVGLLTLLFNLGGVADYLGTHLFADSYLAGFPPEQRAYFESFPAWQVAFWALGVWGAFASSILILARSRFAVHAMVVGLIGLAVMTAVQYSGGLPPSLDTAGVHIFNTVIWIACVLTLLYAVRQARRGVLR